MLHYQFDYIIINLHNLNFSVLSDITHEKTYPSKKNYRNKINSKEKQPTSDAKKNQLSQESPPSAFTDGPVWKRGRIQHQRLRINNV